MSELLEIPTLGRPFRLGIVYDYCSDCILPDVTLWHDNVLKEVITKTSKKVSQFDIITDILPAEALGVEGSLKLSYLGGLIKESHISGSARYLYDYQSSKQARVAIRYKYISYYEEVKHEQIPNDQYYTLSKENGGTHIVTGISCGVEAIFVIDQEVADCKQYQHIYEGLQEKAAQFCKALNEQCDVDLLELPATEELSVTYFGDFSAPQRKISTFQDVAKFCKNLPENNSSLVPQQVWLHPLSTLNSGMFNHLDLSAKTISTRLVGQIENVMQHLHDIESRCNSLIKTNVYRYFIGIQEQLSMFISILSKYKHNFVERLAILLPRIRGGKEEEQALEKLCEEYLTSCINCQVLSNWIEDKESEVTFVAECIEELQHVPGGKLEFPSAIDCTKRVIAFEFNAIEKTDQALVEISACMQSEKQICETYVKETVKNPWYKNEAIKENVVLKMRQFSTFAKSNADDDNITFIVTDTSEGTHTFDKSVHIVSYTNGQRIDQDFEPPSVPYQLVSSSVQHNSISLSWSKPQYGSPSVQSYTMFYYIEDDPLQKCKSQMSEGPKTTMTIIDLVPETRYIFKVQANCPTGKSEMSKKVIVKTDVLVGVDDQHTMNVPAVQAPQQSTNALSVPAQQIPTLGRPFCLGIVYDYCSDCILPDVNLWHDNVLKEVITKTSKKVSQFDIITDILPAEALGIEGSLKLSYLGGLIKESHISGSARYLYDYQSSKQARVAIRYKYISHYEEVNHEQIPNDQYYTLSKENGGTHIVTGISYGVEAIFVIDQEVGDCEKYQHIYEGLQEKAAQFCKALNEQCDVDLLELPAGEELSVTYFGDFSAPQMKISTFQDVAKFCKNLPENNSSLVPQQVCLHPLSELNSGMFPHLDLCIISTYLVRQVENIMQCLHDIEIKCSNLMNTNVYQYFIGIQEQLSKFFAKVSAYKDCFIKQLGVLLPNIRGGQEKEQELEKLCLNSHFNHEVLPSWIEEKLCEITFITECLETLHHMSGVKLEFPTVIDPMKTVIAFEFKAINKIDRTLTTMSEYLDSDKQIAKHSVQTPWYKNEAIKENVTQKMSQFISFAKSNADDDSIKFIVTDTSEDTHDYDKGIQIVSYSNGQIDDQNFEPPSSPYQLEHSSVQHNSIKLIWSKPQYGSTSVQHYIVFYHAQQDSALNCKSEMTKALETTTVITNLVPNTSYTFRVQAACIIGKSEPSIGITVKTLDDCQNKIIPPCQATQPTINTLPVPGQPSACNVTDSSIELMWEEPKPCDDSIDHYIVSCCCVDDDEEDKIFPTENNKTSIVIFGLAQETSYQFRVSAQYKTGLGKVSRKSKAIQTNRLVLVAGPPGKPSVVNATSNSIDLKWEKPQKNSDNIEEYKVLYRSKDDPPNSEWNSKQTNGVVEHITISELVSKKAYSFKVQATYNKVDGAMSPVSEDIITKCILASPGEPRASDITHDSLKLYWSEPFKNSFESYDELQCYKVLYRSLYDCQNNWESHVIPNTSTNTVIHGLSPATKYVFKVQAGSSDHHFGKDSKESIPIETKQITPCRPGRPECEKNGDTRVQLGWTKPTKNAENVQHYVVSYCCIDDEIRVWKEYDRTCVSEEILVTGLTPCTRYYFKVQAIFKNGPSEISEGSDTIQTLVPLPGIPGQPKAVSTTHNSVNLKWTKPTQYPEYVMQYCVYYHSQEEKAWSIRQVTGVKENITVDGLSPKTTYLFTVQAQNRTGSSERSEVSAPICTLTPVPSQPGQPRSVNISYDKVTITWAKPKLHAEHVQNYKIQYIPITNTSSTTWWTTVNTESAVEELVVCGLEVNTSYIFKVNAECIDGSSEESDTSNEIQTLVPIPSKPEQPEAVSVTYNSISLKWTKPTQYSEFVTNYQGYYFSLEEPEKQKPIIEVEEKLTVTGLSPETMYVFRLHAHSKTGSSETNEISIHTLPPVPSQPGQPQAVNISHDKITVIWAKPQENAEYIQSYTINYKKDSETQEWTTFNTEIVKEVSVVSGLEPNTNYIFKVQAESTKGPSKESEVSSVIKTRSPIPSQPGKPTYRVKAHDRITLVWSKPNEYYENVECYEISYFDNKIETRRTNGPVEEITIGGLDPQKGYYFKVHAKSRFGDSPNSLSSDQIGTDHIRPVLKILPNCTMLQDSPAIHLLSTTKSATLDEQKYAKFEYGKATYGTKNKVLMIVGATGSGKSTLINGMVNYLLGVEWDDEFRLKLIHEKVKSQTKSVTKFISAYTFHKHDDFPLPYSLTIVDTPGFGDTEGMARDKEITSQIKEFFSLPDEQGIDHLDGIGFVTQGGLARLTPTQLYIFDSIFSVFGKDMKNNIFTMVTFADSADPPVIEAIKEAGIPYTEYFQFNNSALYTVNTNKFAQMFWNMGVKSFKHFFDKFEKSQSVSLILTREVLDQREHLEVVIIGLHTQIQAGMLKINNLKREQQILRENEEKIKANENFMYEVEEDCMEKVKLDLGKHVTICFKCNFTCHYPCGIPNDDDKYLCAAMNLPKNETTTCSNCPGKCAWQQHNNAEYRLEFKRRKVEKCYENVKKEYFRAKGGKVKVKNVIAGMEEDIQTHFQIMLQNIIEAHSCIQRLDEIALKRHPLTDVGYIDLLIEAELRERKPGFEERVENYRVVREQAELIGKAKEMPQATLSIEETVQFWNKFVQVEPDVAISLPPVKIPPEGIKSRVTRAVDKAVDKVDKVVDKFRKK